MDENRSATVKRFILFGILTVLLLVIGWYLYAHFRYKTRLELQNQEEIYEFTRSLYDLELKHNPYLVGVNFQGRTDNVSTDDVAPEPLLQVNESSLVLKELHTIALLRNLYNNYVVNTSVTENITSERKQEELDFLTGILATPIMKKTMEFLEQKEIVANDTEAQLRLLNELWFMPYSREPGYLSSSGFEHVFLAELHDNIVLGLHNWVYFSEQEKLGHLDYKGYYDIKVLEKDYQYIVMFRSQFYNRTKPYNGILVGTSPELEMSLYTVCFVLSLGKPCPVQLGDLKFTIITYVKDWEGRETIGSAFASIVD